MVTITDEFMQEQLAQSQQYSLVLLKASEAYGRPENAPVIREHGRRNFQLRAEGRLSIVAPVLDDSPLCGMGIFPGTRDEVIEIMEGDPAVQAGIFSYDIHPIRSFPGDALS